ncbi:MAG TPA: histidine phosphatase family protein [Lacipirellulaceae bacterium]|jgi:phosphohistidine phosphatase|nr:histidine phosphatase family protein [Lacipirellulaceae bacterium]
MFIYIARHAWAGERGDPRWPDDSLRELTPEGIERYSEVVKLLAECGFAPERIVTSPYTRCRQTADIIAKYIDGKPKIDELEALEPGSDLEPLIEWTNEQGGKNVCWVGHSPDVERLAAELIGDGASRVRFAKGAVAAIGFEGDAANAGGGELYWLATAKMLGV